MARFEGLPDDYDPTLTFQIREKPEGGRVRDPGALHPKGGPVPSRREILVMVHGFNNHEGQAAKAYLGFRLGQYATFGSIPAGSLDRQLADAFWPGDADWGLLDFAEAVVYGRAVYKAKDSAQSLVQTIRKIPNLEKISFIAHSLGCRVVLETLEELLKPGHPAIGRVCLMAPAVPVEMVATGGRYAGMLRKLQGLRVKIRILHSTHDGVLAGAFIPGQASAGPREASLRALGRRGPPHDMPGLGDNVTHQQIYGAGHSNYWGHELNEAALHALRDAGGFFGFAGPSRTIGKRPIG